MRPEQESTCAASPRVLQVRSRHADATHNHDTDANRHADYPLRVVRVAARPVAGVAQWPSPTLVAWRREFNSHHQLPSGSAGVAQTAERILGKDEVPSSILGVSSMMPR
jgi:hypothetical protein